MYRSSQRLSGFTLVELAVVITLLPLIIGGFVFMLYASLDSMAQDKKRITLKNSQQIALSVIEQDVRSALSFQKTISAPYSDAYGQDNAGVAWTHQGTPANASNRVLILSTPSTTGPSLSPTRALTYVDSASYNCSTQLNLNPVQMRKIIYFVRDETLYRRMVTDTSTALCNTQYQKQSCPPELRSTWAATCEAADEALAANVSSLDVTYHKERAAAAISDAYTSSDPAVLDQADDVTVSITSSLPYGSSTVDASSTLRITKATGATL